MSIVTFIATKVAQVSVGTASMSCEAYHVTAATGKAIAKASSVRNKQHKNNRQAFMDELERKLLKTK